MRILASKAPISANFRTLMLTISPIECRERSMLVGSSEDGLGTGVRSLSGGGGGGGHSGTKQPCGVEVVNAKI